jgi:ribonuclease BN (tRNA processing enzyme)
MKGNTVRVWGPKQGDVDLEAILRQQMAPAVFPVPLDALAATLEVKHVNDEPFVTSVCTVRSMRVRHPANTMGYRLETADGKSIVYVTDDELGPAGNYDVGANWRGRFVDFIGGTDLLIHDAMYTPEEYSSHAGWGHSTFVEAVELAREAGVQRLALFHHEPEHGDEQMDAIADRAREAGAKSRQGLEVCAAAEGQTISL